MTQSWSLLITSYLYHPTQNSIRASHVVVQWYSCVPFFMTTWAAAHQVSWPHLLPEFAQVHVQSSVIPSQPFHPLMPFFSSAFYLLSIRDFSKVAAACVTLPKYWSPSFSISPSCKIDWFDLLSVQGTSGVSFSTIVLSINSLMLFSLWSSSQTTCKLMEETW